MKKQPIILMLALAGLAGFWDAARAGAYERADLLPARVDLRVWISSIEACTNAAKLSPLWRLWRDEGFQNFLGHPDLANWWRDKDTTKAQAALEQEQWNLLKGEVWFAGNGLGQAESEIYMVAQLSREDYQKNLDIDKKLAELDRQKIKITHVDFQGQDVVQTISRDHEGKEETSWQTHLQNTLLMSNRKAWLEQTVARLKRDGAPTAAKIDPPLIEAMLSGPALVRAFTDGFNKGSKNPAAGNPTDRETLRLQQMPMPGRPGQGGPKIDGAAVVKALGLNTLNLIKLTVKLEKTQTLAVLSIDRGAARNGVWTMLDPRPTPPTMRLPYLPPNVISYGVGRMNCEALWNEIPIALTGIDPMLVGMFAMLNATLQKDFGLNLGQDVLAHLDTALVVVKSLQNNTDYTLVGWQLKNAQGLNATLKRIMAPESPLRAKLPGDLVKTEDFRGVTLYTVEKGFDLDPPGGPAPDPKTAAAQTNLTVGVAILDNLLYIGEAEQVRGVIRAKAGGAPAEPAFYRSAIFQNMLRNKPDNASAYELTDLTLLIKSACQPENVAKMKQLIQRMPDRKAGSGDLDDDEDGADDDDAGSLNRLLKELDFSKLPPADRLAAFFGPLYAFTTAAGDRIEVQWMFKYPEKP